MLATRASTSAGSTAGKSAMRSWLRPSLRYGSVSTMPFARSVFAIAAPLEVFRSADTRVEEARLVAFDAETYEQIVAQLED